MPRPPSPSTLAVEPVVQQPSSKLYLIDASAPFFLEGYSGKTNWSKINFTELEDEGKVKKRTRREIRERFESYARRVSSLGYNAISLDDLAHVTKFGFYPKELKRKLKGYRKLYRDLLSICVAEGLRVFLNTDLMFHLAGLESVERGDERKTTQVIGMLCRGLRKTFERFPEVEGVIFRLGESDGLDVESEFKSRLMIMDPEAGNRLLREIQRVLRSEGRTMIVRTWTVGAYRVGDLMWNRDTFDRLFRGLAGPDFYVSMKYGDTDFFKYLELNPLFLRGPHQKLIELQARREYEGFGCFPSYVGFDYQRYRDQLEDVEQVRGMMVWCQTGGWSHFRNMTFVQHSSPWNELNTYACLRLFRDGWSAEDSVLGFCREVRPELNGEALLELVRDADRVIERLWYLPGYSSQSLYFRRVRVPPLLWVLWDTILVNHALRKVLRRLVHDREASIEDGYAQLETIRSMQERAPAAGLESEDFELQYDTFEILAIAREYFLAEDHRPAARRLEEKVEAYAARHPEGFLIELSFSPWNIRSAWLKALLRVFMRRSSTYRVVDRAALNVLTKVLYPIANRLHARKMPGMLRKQAMGIEVIFR